MTVVLLMIIILYVSVFDLFFGIFVIVIHIAAAVVVTTKLLLLNLPGCLCYPNTCLPSHEDSLVNLCIDRALVEKQLKLQLIN